jgi:hypothetical protein
MTFDDLAILQQQLIQADTVQARNDILAGVSTVRKRLLTDNGFSRFLRGASPETECALKQLAAIGQGLDIDEESLERWHGLAKTAVEIDRFYREIGGIVGYQVSILQMLQKTDRVSHSPEKFHSPIFSDISEPTDEVSESIRRGLIALPMMAELYPLGGAADRLHLVDVETGLELPAAKLEFAGCTLLETLLRDLFAREWLYYCLFGQQIQTPVAIMTSYEKDNYRHVLKICEENDWFGRSKESFRFFIQPLVPAVDEKGDWYTTGSCRPFLKPGGHGAIWKLARDEGIFDWLKSLGCKKALVRQINNPIAGLDYGLIAFVGIGAARDMSFGFASCSRRVSSAEGIVVLKEAYDRIVLTNIEYCDFLKKGINDEPVRQGELYSRFSSNTNILFADLSAVEQAVSSHPFPGLLMNLKPAQLVDESGLERQVMLARLESTMQNIADAFDEPKLGLSLDPKKTFVTYNRRYKTISVAKKAYLPGKSLLETPEYCFYELLQASRELLVQCGFTLPQPFSVEEYMNLGPDCVFLYHPALGPLYSIIQQKLRGGQMCRGSEFCLEIAELDAEKVCVDGSFRVIASQLLGKCDEKGVLQYSDQVGQCILRDVRVQNLGVDWERSSPFWNMALRRKESVEIILKGRSIFDAENVVFEGAHRFVVEDGVRMTVRQKNGKITVLEERALEGALWRYVWEKGVKLYRD